MAFKDISHIGKTAIFFNLKFKTSIWQKIINNIKKTRKLKNMFAKYMIKSSRLNISRALMSRLK